MARLDERFVDVCEDSGDVLADLGADLWSHGVDEFEDDFAALAEAVVGEFWFLFGDAGACGVCEAYCTVEEHEAELLRACGEDSGFEVGVDVRFGGTHV